MGMGVCDMVLRKYDKKKERPLLFGHRAGLLEQLQLAEDPSAVLLLAALIIFEIITQTMLHASGRFVSQILEFIRTGLSNEDYMELQHFYGKGDNFLVDKLLDNILTTFCNINGLKAIFIYVLELTLWFSMNKIYFLLQIWSWRRF